MIRLTCDGEHLFVDGARPHIIVGLNNQTVLLTMEHAHLVVPTAAYEEARRTGTARTNTIPVAEALHNAIAIWSKGTMPTTLSA